MLIKYLGETELDPRKVKLAHTFHRAVFRHVFGPRLVSVVFEFWRLIILSISLKAGVAELGKTYEYLVVPFPSARVSPVRVKFELIY